MAHFSHWLDDFLRHPVRPGNEMAGESPDSLQLVNVTEFEETLAVSSLVEKLSQRFSDDLYCMEQRFSHLFPDAAIGMDSLPFGPGNLCQAFQYLLEELDPDLESRLYHFKRLDKVLMKTAGDYFHDINSLLIAESILPELKRKVIKRDDQERVVTGTVPAGTGAPAPSSPPHPPMQHMPQPDARMYQAIQQLLALGDLRGHGDADQVATGRISEDNLFSVTPRLLEQLSQLQTGQTLAAQRGMQGGHVSLKEQVNAVLVMNDGAEQAHALNQIDNDTIDVISMIFDLILDDRSLPDFVKALIGRLQIPILKAAIIDRGFFRHKTHPARQLVNKLAYAGVGWSEDCEATQDRLYKKMESIVLRVLDEFESDMRIFEELLTEFSAFIDCEKREFELAREQIRQEAQAREEREQQKRKIVGLIMERNKTDPVPDDILEFLVTVWSQVVVEAAMAADGEGFGRGKAIQFIDDLVWSLAPKHDQEQRRNLIRVLPEILRVMREGLEWIAYDEDKSNTVFAALEQYHVTVLKGSGTEPRDRGRAASPNGSEREKPGDTGQKVLDREIAQLTSEIELLPDLDDDTYDLFNTMEREETAEDQGRFDEMMAEMGLAREDDSGPRIEDEFTELVRGLELGAWIELHGDDGRRMRVKLAWRGDQFTNFSFVNRHYKVVAERPFYVLADEFRQGGAIRIDAPDLFDRALDGVISGVMRVVG